MKTSITIIAICEVIRTVQITVDLVFGFYSISNVEARILL